MAGLLDSHRALREAVGAVELGREFVLAAGPDAEAFLQGQLSQDVAALAEGGSARSLLLSPEGRLVAWLRVSRLAADRFVLDVEAGAAEPMLARLHRFKLRTKCELTRLDGWRAVALRGPLAPAAAADARAVVRADAGWPLVPGVDLLGPDAAAPAGVPSCSPAAYDWLRIANGEPAWGRELTEGLIPAEAGIVEASVSWTKGCYTGQELVARIDSRGANTPRRLRGVLLPELGLEAPDPPADAELEPVGGGAPTRLSSLGRLPEHDCGVGLAYAHRSITPPADAVLRWAGGSTPARIVTLPVSAA
ncbi:MAG: YgfZ/GcvT domain-containing protein [Acidimicrobiales bacterium]